MELRATLIGLSSLFLLPACCEEAAVCEPSGIQATIQMRKTTEGCSEVDILQTISFGVSFEFEVEVQCGDGCTGNRIFYHRKLYKKDQDGVVELGMAGSVTRAYYDCNQVVFPSQTLYTEVNNPGPVTFAVGDTIRYEFYDPGFCLSDDITGCATSFEPLDLPDLAFEYVLAPEDFDCE